MAFSYVRSIKCKKVLGKTADIIYQFASILTVTTANFLRRSLTGAGVADSVAHTVATNIITKTFGHLCMLYSRPDPTQQYSLDKLMVMMFFSISNKPPFIAVIPSVGFFSFSYTFYTYMLPVKVFIGKDTMFNHRAAVFESSQMTIKFTCSLLTFMMMYNYKQNIYLGGLAYGMTLGLIQTAVQGCKLFCGTAKKNLRLLQHNVEPISSVDSSSYDIAENLSLDAFMPFFFMGLFEGFFWAVIEKAGLDTRFIVTPLQNSVPEFPLFFLASFLVAVTLSAAILLGHVLSDAVVASPGFSKKVVRKTHEFFKNYIPRNKSDFVAGGLGESLVS